MHAITRQQLIGLVLITLVWGLNWPVMKLGVTDYPPLTFRAISLAMGVAGLLIGAMLNLLGSYVSWVTPQLLLPTAFVLMLVVLLVKPSGLFGRTQVRRV